MSGRAPEAVRTFLSSIDQSHDIAAAVAVRLAWLSDAYDEARAVVELIEPSAKREEASKWVEPLVLAAKERYYEAWVAYDAVKPWLFSRSRASAVKTGWIVRYLHVRFENGHNDRNASLEMAQLVSYIDPGYQSAWVLGQIISEYYGYHITPGSPAGTETNR